MNQVQVLLDLVTAALKEQLRKHDACQDSGFAREYNGKALALSAVQSFLQGDPVYLNQLAGKTAQVVKVD